MPLLITSISPLAAYADLSSLLAMSIGGSAHLVLPDNPNFDSNQKININILTSSDDENSATALLGALSYKNQEGLESAIWRASLTRVSSRPADAVFSIMGILGVSLNPLHFDPDDRKAPTIALMQALLRKGERAEWLGVAPHVDLNPEISTLPVFPTIDAQGRALVPPKSRGRMGQSMSAWMGDTWWRLVGAPYGSMEADGTLKLRVSTLPIRRELSTQTFLVPVPIHLIGHDEDVWYTAPGEEGPPYALKIGIKERYTNAAVAPLHDPWPWLVMLVEDDGVRKERCRNLGYAAVGEDVVGLGRWVPRDIVIRGTS
jgi:hypothetical protein